MKAILAGNIRAARNAKGWTQRELAHRVNGVDSQAVSRWERGESVPLPDNMSALSAVLDRDFSWFYTDHDLELAA